MAEEAPAQEVVVPPPETETLPAAPNVVESEIKEPVVNGGDAAHIEPAKEVAKEVAQEVALTSPAPESMIAFFIIDCASGALADLISSRLAKDPESANDIQTISPAPPQNKPAATQEEVEMKEDIKPSDETPVADESADPAIEDSASADKSKARRKSGGIPEHKKKLNKKASKAKMTHTDAKPGDYFFVRLKGYPLWPAIVCDEAMLPTTLLKTRPVTAARPDGTYRADYEDGGSKIKDRTFPVMYLHTNELWVFEYFYF
jgi:hypothetical protein